MPKDPDRSHLADAIHFMDLFNLADEELPTARATVERSKVAAAMARGELDKHLQWLPESSGRDVLPPSSGQVHKRKVR